MIEKGQLPQTATWRISGETLRWTKRPLLMAILNITPDSFSDGGQNLDLDRAVEHGLRLEAEGADILDLGAESTRPGATPVSLADELSRLMPVVERLSQRVRIPLSIDTYKAEVARQALAGGAKIVNDISGLQFDPGMSRVVVDAGAGIVCMHIQGTPQTMQQDPTYENVVAEVVQYFAVRLETLKSHGIAPEQVVFDPGVGFGKTAEHNLELLSNVGALQAVGRPVLIGHSRKGFLKRVLGRSVDERLSGTLGVSIALAEQGAEIIRVHDVAANRDALVAWQTVREWRSDKTRLPSA